MKGQPKAVFLLLATFAASASANVLTGTIRGKHELSAELENPGELEETYSSFEAVETVPDEIAGLEEDEDYDDEDEDEDYDVTLDEEDQRRRRSVRGSFRRDYDDDDDFDEEGQRRRRSVRNSFRRDGQRFDFEREGSGQCVDRDRRTYSYGQINGVRNISRCGRECVRNVRSNQLRDLVGYEYIRSNDECRCLFERGTLTQRNARSRFDRASTSGQGRGPVRRTRSRSGFRCYTLTSSSFVGMNGEFDEETDEDYEMES